MKSNEDRAREYAQELREAAKICTQIKPVLERFDGKVYNIRIERALQEIARVYREHSGDYIVFYTYIGKTYNNRHVIMRVKRSDGLRDGKRIRADKFIEATNECRQELLKKAYTIDATLPQMPEVLQQIEALKKQLNAVSDSLPYMIRDIYKIHYRIY